MTPIVLLNHCPLCSQPLVLFRTIPPLNGLGPLVVWKCPPCRLTQFAEPENLEEWRVPPPLSHKSD